jgi:hypothetical protein
MQMIVRILAMFSVAALAICTPALAADFDCGPRPSLQCVGAHLIGIGKRLPPDHWFHERTIIAERELAPTNPRVALEYLVDPDLHPAPWERTLYLTLAGLLDRALEIARSETEPDARIGGLIEVAGHLAQAKDFERAAQLLSEVEPLLPTVADGNIPHESLAADISVRIGQPDRAVRILGDRDGSLYSLLTIATKYPEVAADFRRRAWAQAERRADPIVWFLVVQDAADRGDADTVAQAARHVLATIRNDDPERRVRVAETLVRVGRPEQAWEAIQSWRDWTAQANGVEYNNLARSIVQLLVALGKGDEVELVATRITGALAQSGTYGVAADKLFALGRSTEAARFEAKAIEIAVSAPYTNQKARWERDAAVHNLALIRSRRGDARGAIELASQVNNEKRERELMFYMVGATLTHGDKGAALRTVEQLARLGRADGDPDTLVKAAAAMLRLDRRLPALFLRAEALEFGRRPGASMNRLELAELTWRLEQDVNAALAHLDAKNDERIIANFAARLAPESPAAALQVAGGLNDAENQREALLTIAQVLSTGNRN